MDSETWKFINTFAPWLSAIGTIAAVIVSLYLARAEKPVKLTVRAGHRIMIEQGQREKPPEFLYISAINTGHRIATITNVGWKIGLRKKRYAIQVVQKDLYSSGVPVKIDDGEEAKWFIPLDLEDNWIQRFSRDFLMPHPRWNLFWLRIQIFTSVGKIFEARIENNLKDELLAQCMKQSNPR
jgi:hypothetical protein